MEEMRVELAALTRKELQSLAKQEGIRANGRSADIIETLLQAAFPEFFPESCDAEPRRNTTGVTPLRGSGASVPRLNVDAPAATGNAAALLMSPRMAAIGSARRVVSTQPRTAGAAAASLGPAPSASAAGSLAAAAPGPPPTPLQKPARRTVDERSIDDSDKQLEALVERCLRIANPDAPESLLHGPEPAKRWLQQNIAGPLKRAAAARSGAASSSSSICAAAGYCHKSLLLYGPSGCGKTELVHALARDMGANLLYIPAGDLLKSCQEQSQRLLRAIMRVARRVSPCVVCFDDAHRSFPAGSRSPSQQRMLVELTVQLQQLADMQQQLQERQQQRCSGGGSAADAPGLMSPASKGPRPAWGAVQGGKQQQKPEEQVQRQHSAKQQQPGYASLGGPVVVVFASRHPEALDPSLLGLLQLRLLLDVPAGESREELLLSWLMEKEAAVGVNDVEQLARDTEGFSCSDLLQLCTEAAMRPLQERARRAICMRDFEAAFLKVTPSVPPQRRAQLLAWTGAQQ
ncbi:hypothetical protein OEZ86_007412 [Tetradesmus obliquus]|nr:hypothetical protein OEZ86_007412 [Tetradesmus obliquus]